MHLPGQPTLQSHPQAPFHSLSSSFFFPLGPHPLERPFTLLENSSALWTGSFLPPRVPLCCLGPPPTPTLQGLFSFPGPFVPPGQALYPPGAAFHLQDLSLFTALPKLFSTILFCFLTICKWEFSFTLQSLFYTYSFF